MTALAKDFCLASDKNDESTTSTIAKSTDASENDSGKLYKVLLYEGQNFAVLVPSKLKNFERHHQRCNLVSLLKEKYEIKE